MENNYILIPKDELMHYGVPGMKWGVRRYQNKDGSLTKIGSQRYYATSVREDTAARSKHGRKVLAKYEKLKTVEQKQADKQVVETHRKLKQSREARNLGDDFAFLETIDTRPNSKIAKLYHEAINANTVRAQAYAGAKWYNKYGRELGQAIDKDNRERGLYR